MNNKLDEKEAERIRLRQISDYIFSCISRVENEIGLISHIKKDKNLFSEKKYLPIILSICDVYSRDIIITLNHLLDKDIKTSSLFSLLDSLKKPRIKEQYKKRLNLIENNFKGYIKTRNNQVAHFNTKLNIPKNGYSYIHQGYILMRYKDTKNVLKEIEDFYFDIKEKLKIEGTLLYFNGNLKDAFLYLIDKK